jgi:putative resolvase
MKLSHWAKQEGITYQTAWNLFKRGQLPNAYQLQSGTIIIKETEEVEKDEYTVTYARVSSSENKKNLVSQSDRLRRFCNAKGWKVDLEIIEVGSGLNDGRKKLYRLLQEGKATRIVVEHKDRLARFGVKYIELICQHTDCELIIINPPTTNKEDLISDFISIITSFCARIYGQRRTDRKTESFIEELEQMRPSNAKEKS